MQIDPFDISIIHDGNRYRMHVEQIVLNDSFERFSISAGGRKIVIQGDRPVIRMENVNRSIKWQLYSGEYKNVQALAWTIKEIERVVLMKEESANRPK